MEFVLQFCKDYLMSFTDANEIRGGCVIGLRFSVFFFFFLMFVGWLVCLFVCLFVCLSVGL